MLLKRPAFYVVVFLVAAGCVALFKWRSILRQALPEVERVTISNIALVNDSAYVDVQIDIRNKGITSFELQEVNLRVFNDTVLLVHYANTDHYVLEKNQVKELPLSLVIPVKSTIHQIHRLQNQDSTFLHVVGWVDIVTDISEKKFPVEKYISVEVPVPPQIRIEQVEYRGKSESDGLYDFIIDAKMVNGNDKELWLKDVSYDFIAQEHSIESHGKISKDIIVPARDSINLSIPFRVKVSHEMELAWRVLFDKDIIGYKFMIKGTIASVAGITQGIPASYSSNGKFELYNPGRKKIRIVINKKKNRLI